MIAAMEGDTSIGRLLIEKGADLDRRNNHRDTALSLAAHTGHPSIVVAEWRFSGMLPIWKLHQHLAGLAGAVFPWENEAHPRFIW
jgi:hypothetical protein